jgi:ATP-dependent DNA ligase
VAPVPLPGLEPMLAVSRPARVPDTLWSFEPKLDGWRALVYIDGGVTVGGRWWDSWWGWSGVGV